MGTATSRALPAALAALVIVITGCGGKRSDAFAWLRPASPPSGWSSAAIPDGATLAYPAGWSRVHGDPGTASAILFGPNREIVGYLNATPRQGAETLSNWAHFRVDHDAEEGDRDIKAVASATGLRFRSGHGSCVQDSYVTETGSRYVELACLVAGSHSTSVVVGAAPPRQWARVSSTIERAISAFRT
jgi:hypothetical protein